MKDMPSKAQATLLRKLNLMTMVHRTTYGCSVGNWHDSLGPVNRRTVSACLTRGWLRPLEPGGREFFRLTSAGLAALERYEKEKP